MNYNFNRIFYTYLDDVDVSEPDYDGWLLKQSKYIATWRKRFFVLKGDKLYFMENRTSAPHGVINLQHALTIKSAAEKVNREFCFEIKTKAECYYLCAESKKAKEEWIGRLGKAIVIHSSSYKSSPLV